MFGAGFDGTSFPDDFQKLLDRGVSHSILFRRNITDKRQMQDLCAQIKRRATGPLAMCLDHEGGRVMRTAEDFTPIPSAREVGAMDDPNLAREIGKVMARELRATNIDVDFAPVLDVDTNPANPVIAERSYGPTPDLVARVGCAVMHGLQSEGVAACGKHFPGHGDTSQDSHKALPHLPHTEERLEEVELVPFERAIREGISSIMTAHVIYTPIDDHYPATMSREVMTDILRRKFGFDGLIHSDDMQMKAIADHYGIEEAVIRGANAGVDVFWICHAGPLQHEAIDHLIRAVERGDVPIERVKDANRHIDELFAKYVQSPVSSDLLSVVGSEEHRAIVSRVKSVDDRDGSLDPTEAWR
jgi:beta-N-acetylhexosaminidase